MDVVTADIAVPGAALDAVGLTKRFGQIEALVDVDFSVASGEVVAVVGDNGAGKSTLLKILAGIISPDRGEVRIAGFPAAFRSVRDARRAGVAMVFQDLALVDELDVATNLFLGDFPQRGILLDRRRMEQQTSAELDALGVSGFGPRTPVGLLTGGQRQLLAIARALRLDSPIVAMDEPTAALGILERTRVAEVVDDLRNRGKAVVLVSHDLEFVLNLADRIDVIQLGRTVGRVAGGAASRDTIIDLITGVPA